MTKNWLISVVGGVFISAFLYFVLWPTHNSGETFFSILFGVACVWVFEMTLTNQERSKQKND